MPWLARCFRQRALLCGSRTHLISLCDWEPVLLWRRKMPMYVKPKAVIFVSRAGLFTVLHSLMFFIFDIFNLLKAVTLVAQ